MSYVINEVVAQMGQISFEGNIISNEWYIHLRNEKGKIQTNAALILADIVYWYRPTPIYEIKTGEITGYGKKFKDDLVQINYKYLENKFGFSEAQSRSALIFLEKKGLIFREFRDIVVAGHVLNNVMYIGIYPEKITKITAQSNHLAIASVDNIIIQTPLGIAENKIKESVPFLTPKLKEKDWSAKFTPEQKEFLSYLLNISPEIGYPIEKNHATWWIKSFGIEKIKTALLVYWQRVEKAKQDSTVPMPEHIGKYVRKALNEGILPMQITMETESDKHQSSVPYSKKPEQVVENIEIDPKKNETTNTKISSMTSLSLNEINDESTSLTFQKEKKKLDKENSLDLETKGKLPKSCKHELSKNSFKKVNKNQDWRLFLTSDERRFLSYLINLKPEKGCPIEEMHATWWIKNFGIEKIKIALKVYWQQVEKAKKNHELPMPNSMGAYVRDALNKGTQPCREIDIRNKTFAEQFKKQVGWCELTITEKYCRAEGMGKEWYYHMPEALFAESLKNSFENCYDYSERNYQKAI